MMQVRNMFTAVNISSSRDSCRSDMFIVVVTKNEIVSILSSCRSHLMDWINLQCKLKTFLVLFTLS